MDLLLRHFGCFKLMKSFFQSISIALVMSLITASGANATTCLRVSDNKQFKLEFYKGFENTYPLEANELWLRSDDKTYIAKIIDQNSADLFAAYFNWKYNTPTVETFHFDRIKHKLYLFASKLSGGGQTVKLDEFLCTKPQN